MAQITQKQIKDISKKAFDRVVNETLKQLEKDRIEAIRANELTDDIDYKINYLKNMTVEMESELKKLIIEKYNEIFKNECE